MDEKGSKTTFHVNMFLYGPKKGSSLKYGKMKVFDIENHEREVKVRKVITGLEDKQIQFKWFRKKY